MGNLCKVGGMGVSPGPNRNFKRSLWLLRVGVGADWGLGAGGKLVPSRPDTQLIVASSKTPALQNGATQPESTVKDTPKVQGSGMGGGRGKGQG